MPRPVEIEDFARIVYVSDPNISPDGEKVAYVVTTVSLEGRSYSSNLWLAGTLSDANPRRLTASSGKDTAPKWSPSGERLAFLSDRTGKPQIHLLDPGGGEAARVTNLSDGVRDYAWAPDGQAFVFVGKADKEGNLVGADEKDGQKTGNEASDVLDVLVITNLQYKRDGEGFLDGRPTQVGIVDLAGKVRQVTTGEFDHAQPAWSPCGRYLAFVTNRTEDRDANRVSDIWLHDLRSGQERPLTGSDGSFAAPVFSPDGSMLAFVGNVFSERYGPTTISGLWTVDLSEGSPRLLTSDLDRDVGGACISDTHYVTPPQRPIWLGDSSAIYCTIGDRGSVPVVRIALDGEWSAVMAGALEVLNFTRSESGILASALGDATRPAEIHLHREGHEEPHRLTKHNDQLLDQIAVSAPERLPVRTSDGAEIDAWLIKPPGFRDGVKYPLVLEIHGGPHAMYGHSFMHEFQMLASQGYVVLFGNPRGSTGYGQDFVAAAMGDWGGVDYQDVMATVDAACALDFVDVNRLGVTGGSYGGYLTNWIITQTDRFRAAVTQRSTTNRYNLFGTSDLVWSYSEWEFDGLPFDNVDFYFERSPISHVERVSTPLLILHSERDYRCPIEQAEQLYVALKRLRRTVEFVRFPEESHNLSRSGRPDRRRERLRRISGWFGRFL
jgi:dipeptidyl aminopeptidase/acylaminoacyl peptidase